jgi:antitoxin (DNA-binding transcriptional repressor) of toxin-antitoxin stability system
MTLTRHPEPCADVVPFGRYNSTRAVSSLDALTDVHHADDRSG